MNSKIKKLLGKNLKRFLSGFLAFAIMLTNITPVAYAFPGRLLMLYRLDNTNVMSEYNPNNQPTVGDGNTVYFALTDMDGVASRPDSHSFGDTDYSGVQGMIASVNANNEVVVSFNQDATPGHKFIQLTKGDVNYVFYFNLIGGTIGGMGGGHPSGIEIQWDYDFGMGANQFVVPDNSTKSVDLYVRNLPTHYTVDVLLGYVDTSVSDHPFVPYAETKGITLVRHSDDHITVNFDGKYLRDGNPGDYINGFFHVAAVIKNEDGAVVASRGFDGYWESTHNGDNGGAVLPQFNSSIEYAILGSNGGQVWEEYVPGTILEISPYTMFGVRFMAGPGMQVANSDVTVSAQQGVASFSQHQNAESGQYTIVYMEGVPGQHDINFTICNQESAIIRVNAIDNSGGNQGDGIVMMVWDDFAQTYVGLSGLNLGQGYQDEIAFFDQSGIVDGQRITDVQLIVVGDMGTPPHIVKDGNHIIIYGNDENGNPASGEYIVRFKIDNVYKELDLYIVPCEPPQNPENDFFSESLPQVEHDPMIDVYAVTGPPENPTSGHIEGYFGSMQGSMLGVEFYDDGNKVDAYDVELVGHSPDIYVEMNSEWTSYGGIDIRVNQDARIGYHCAVFKVNGKTATVIVYANPYVDIGGGSGGDQPSTEDTFKGTTEIAPNVPAMQLPAGYSNWFDYDAIMAGTGGFQTVSDNLFAIRFTDENGNVIPSSRVNLVSGHDTVMEFAMNADYKIVYFGDREFIGECYLTYEIDGQYYKTIKVVSQYAVIKDHQNENPTRVILDNFRGSLNIDLDESYGDVILELRGENIAHSHRSAAIKVAKNLIIEGAGSLEIAFESEENNTTAIEIGGWLNMHGCTDDSGETPYLKIKDTGRSKLGADIIIGQNDCSINDYGVEVEGDITLCDNSDEYRCLYVNNSYVIANNIFAAKSVQFENSILKTYLIQSHEDIHISRTYADIISYEEGVQVGIHADRNVMIMDSSVTVKGYPAYSDSLGFCALIYAGDEISVEEDPAEYDSPTSFDALLVLKTDAEQVYGMAARRMSLHSGTMDITMDGYGSTAIYSYGNPDEDYGVVLHKGRVSINSEGHGIWSNSNIQLGNVDSGKINAGIYAQNGYALATDPVSGGMIILESEGIVLYGSEGAIQAKYVPVSTEEGWYDFGYNPDILLMTHKNSLIDAYPVTTYEETLGNSFVVTAVPDPSQIVTVKFNTNGADYKLLDMQKIIGNNYGQLPVPVKTGYIFLGWSLDTAGMLCVDYGFTVDKEIAKNGVITLYAQWEKGDANTTYLSSVWSKYFDLSEYEASGNYPVFTKGTTIYVDGYSEIDWPAPLVKSETKDIIFTGAGELSFRGEGSDAVINTSAKGTVKFTGKGMLNFYGGGIMSANCIEFNSGVVNIEVDEGYAIKTWRTKPEDIVVVVNKDAEVTAVSNTGIGLDAEGTSVLVKAGGTLRAAGAEYGIYTPANGYLCGNVTVESGGNLLAYGYKAAMRADSYNIKKASGKQMVAGYIPDITKEVKEYNNQRYFAVGEEAYATNEEISTVWVNDYCFAPDEYFEGENFIYVPNTDYDGDKNVNVLYLGKGFKFEAPVDIEGAYAYIFSTEDIVVTSMGEGITQVETAEDVENIYSVYSFGDVRISNIKLGKADQDIYTENLVIDNEAQITAGDVTVNGDLTANIASAYISGELYVDGDAILRGMNSEQVYDKYTLAFTEYGESIIKGNLIISGVQFIANNNLRVDGTLELNSASLVSEEGYSTLDVAGNIYIGEDAVLAAMNIDATKVTNKGTFSADILNVNDVFNAMSGSVNIGKGYVPVYINQLNISGGTFTVESEEHGIGTNGINVTDGVLEITAETNGINLYGNGKLNITGGQVNIEADNIAIYINSGATVTINSATNKSGAVVKLYGKEKAVEAIGKFEPYGTLMTAADIYEGLNNAVTAYNGEKYFYVNGNTFHTVEFNANGGKFVTDTATEDTFTMNVPDNGVVDVHSIAVPSRANYVFTGWYLDEGATQLYEADKAVTESMVLYAGWNSANTVADVSITVDSADDTISIGDRIVLDTATKDATIKYIISTSPIDTSLLDDSQLNVYKEAIQIKKSMLSAELGDVIYVAAMAVKAEYRDSQWTVAKIDVIAGRDNWGDIAEQDRGSYTDALDVPEYLWVANVPEQLTYTGSALKPDDFRVYDGKKLLTAGVDYTVSYKNNTKVGQATITIKGKGNYADSMVEYFEIVPMSIEDDNMFTTDVAGFMKTANGKEQKVSPKLLKDGKALKRNTDYTITYEKWNDATGLYETASPKEAGNYNVVITGKGNYTGTVRMPYTITSNKLATTLKIKVVANKNELVYTGNPIEPAIEVKDGSKVLVNGVDYDVVYEDNINVGKALVSIFAKEGSGYEGGASVGFTITGVKLASKMLKGKATILYEDFMNIDKDDVLPGMTVENNGAVLTAGVDYTVTYTYDKEVYGTETEAGAVTMTVTGIGGYTGTLTKKFTIGTKLNAKMVKDFVNSLTFVDNATDGLVSQSAELYNGTDVMVEGEDYTVRYTNNGKVGTATVEYIGRGGFYGTIKKTFKITAIKLDGKKVEADGLEATFDYVAGGVQQTGYTFWYDGTPLVEGVDYTVSYKNNIKAGKATITFTGMGGYSGSWKYDYKINPVNVEQLNICCDEAVEYTKSATLAEPVISYGDTVLVKGTDYTLKYSGNTKLTTDTAKAKVVVTFKGNYAGKAEFSYDIVKSSLSNVTVNVADVVFKNKVNRFKAVPKLVDTNGKVLAAKTDYVNTLVYTYAEDTTLANGVIRLAGDVVDAKDIVPAGTYIMVTVTGAGNYEGEVSAVYRVISGSVASASVTIEAQNYTGNPVQLAKNQITVKVGGVELADDEYEIIGYTNNPGNGTAKVTIQGVGNYGGTKTVNFSIQAKSAKTTIKFMANGGSGSVAAVTVMNKDVALTSIFNAKGKQTLTRKGYTFVGWNTEKDGSGIAYSDADIFLAQDREGMRTIRLYAQWELI